LPPGEYLFIVGDYLLKKGVYLSTEDSVWMFDDYCRLNFW